MTSNGKDAAPKATLQLVEPCRPIVSLQAYQIAELLHLHRTTAIPFLLRNAPEFCEAVQACSLHTRLARSADAVCENSHDDQVFAETLSALQRWMKHMPLEESDVAALTLSQVVKVADSFAPYDPTLTPIEVPK